MTARRRVPAAPVAPHDNFARPPEPRGGGSSWDSSPLVRVVADNPDEQAAACRYIAHRYAQAKTAAGRSTRKRRAAREDARALLDALGLTDTAAEMAARRRHPAGKHRTAAQSHAEPPATEGHAPADAGPSTGHTEANSDRSESTPDPRSVA